MASKGVRERLAQRIAAGEWQPGESLPSAEALAVQLDVSRVTVHKALTALARDGLLLTRPGKRAVLTGVRSRPADFGPDGGAAAEPWAEGAVDILDRHLGGALRTGRLHVDVLCVTAESFVTALQRQLIGLRARREPVLTEFRIRLLFCDFTALPTFPRVLGDPDDLRPLERLRRVAHDQVTSLRTAAYSLQTYQLVTAEPGIEVRTIPFPPMSKLYVLNEDEVLEGRYQLIERSVDVGGHREILDDLAGLSSRLFVRRRHALANHVDSAYVDAAGEFFESWWTKASPYAVGVTLDRAQGV
ncbi:biotin operon repressor [Streptacidiphilus sp. MAP12-20]|uniref:winged helix-turn-helix domain-containing protein n=1 Tax=Streptacidiphilus sp. MAP12-20 TaxID=3156299 RepID=UPI00351673F7